MSVINTKYDDHSNVNKCAVCGGPLHFPFLCWHQEGSGSGLCICGCCCQRIKDGLMADMIQVACNVGHAGSPTTQRSQWCDARPQPAQRTRG